MQAKAFQSVPVLALTATATDKVKEDVSKILRISGCPVFNVSPQLPHDALPDVFPQVSHLLEFAEFTRSLNLLMQWCVGHRACKCVHTVWPLTQL